MNICHGCTRELEALAAIRVYHGQCDPRGKVDHLRRLLKDLFRVYQAMDCSEFTPPGYEKVMAEVKRELGL